MKVLVTGDSGFVGGFLVKRLKEMEKAEFHFQKANSLSTNAPDLKRRIREAMGDLSSD